MPTVLWAPSTRFEPPFEFVLQGSMGVPLGVGGVLLWACIDWCPTGGSSLVQGSVRARALRCQSTTQQWYCIAATLLRCMGRPYRYTYIPSQPPLVWGYYHLLGCVLLNKVKSRTLHNRYGQLFHTFQPPSLSSTQIRLRPNIHPWFMVSINCCGHTINVTMPFNIRLIYHQQLFFSPAIVAFR